jgi:molybdopterin-guanine dinucleotide biosynthesis protein A
MPLDESKITLAILAGGEGSRMGKPKGMLTISGQPILSYLLERFQWKGPTLLVTAPGREHPPGWEAFDREVVDAVAGEGPLRGLLTALEGSESNLTLVTTVDMPEVGREQIIWLAAAIDGEARGLMVRRQSSGRIEPFPSIFRADAPKLIRPRLAEGLGSVQALGDRAAIPTRDAPAQWAERIWTNLNRPADLKEWLT